jgi:hypothetical protein
MSLHEDFRRADRIEGSSNRAFGLVVAGFCGLMALMRAWSSGAVPVVWLVVALAFLLPALIYPSVLAPFNRAWTSFGMLLAKVTTPVILGLLFYGCFVPIGWIARLFGHEFLRLRVEPSASTYWVRREPEKVGAVTSADAMKNQF